MASTSDANDVERMRRELIKSVTSNWDDVVKIYEQDRRAHKIKLGSENALDVLSIKGGDLENNPLHLAASLEAFACVNVSLVISINNYWVLATAFLERLCTWRFTMLRKTLSFGSMKWCDDSAQAHAYCHGYRGWKVSWILLTAMENSPLHILAVTPTAFRSGISLSFFHGIIYSCIYVEELIIPETFKEKKKVEEPLLSKQPSNMYQLLSSAMEMIKLLGHYSSTGAQGRQVFPSRYDRCLNFFGLFYPDWLTAQ
ncbi:hypothetical protein CK203_063925 [Vitis vinifera]|uniref:Uncharacterized protein n=1 Tax=Vitis vinifera TaxID=29760 RepID=A0A438FPU5_VITVI|nr:hypothetical protein CK203_063925 [Vitis vinifera]